MANKLELEHNTLPPKEQFSWQGNSSNGPGPAQHPDSSSVTVTFHMCLTWCLGKETKPKQKTPTSEL